MMSVPTDFTRGMPVLLDGLDLQSELCAVEEITGIGDTVEADAGSWQGADGGWITPGFRRPQRMELRGRIFGNDPATVESTLARLRRVGVRAPVPLALGFASGWMWRSVQRVGEMLVNHPVGLNRIDYSLPLLAPDPTWWRGQSEQDAATLMLRLVTSTGGGAAWPLAYPMAYGSSVTEATAQVTNPAVSSRIWVTITGPIEDPEIVITHPDGTIDSLRFLGRVDGTLTIDAGRRLALLDGVAPYAPVSPGWPRLFEGLNTIQLRGSAPTSTTPTASFRILYGT